MRFVLIVAVVASAVARAASDPPADADTYCQPGTCRPIDLRTMLFADDFLARWPAFPATSYDAAFGGLAGAWLSSPAEALNLFPIVRCVIEATRFL